MCIRRGTTISKYNHIDDIKTISKYKSIHKYKTISKYNKNTKKIIKPR